MRFVFTLALLSWTTLAAALPLETIKLPPGFAIELWARVSNARQMALGATDDKGGVLYVGSRGAGSVHAVRFDGCLSRRVGDPHRQPAWKCPAAWPGARARCTWRK
jgi:hypothetical protein